MEGYGDRHIYSTREVNLDAGSLTSIALTAFSQRIQIHVLATTVENTAVGGASVLFQDQNSSPVSIGTVIIPASNNQSKMIYKKLEPPYVLEPGHYISYTVTETGTAPLAVLIVEYSLLDEQLASDNTSAVLSA